MPTTRVMSKKSFVYSGVNRYPGEVWNLTGQRNDDKLVKHEFVIATDVEEDKLVRDDSGRYFIDEDARLAYRTTAPKEDTQVRARTGGRPKGSTDKKPRRMTRVAAPEPESESVA